jgi:hypothetical protein
MSTLIYVHIGKVLIDYLIDSVYQTLLVNKHNARIFVLLSDSLIKQFHNQLRPLDTDYLTLVTVIPLSILDVYLEKNQNFLEYRDLISGYALTSFRDSFWISTTCRFFYVHQFVELFAKHEKLIFHIENDIMLYVPFKDLMTGPGAIKYLEGQGHVYMALDSPNRVIPSIMCFDNLESLVQLTRHITKTLKKEKKFMNDMEILAKYPKLVCLPCIPTGPTGPTDPQGLLYDGAAMGQFLGGVDPRNISGTDVPTTLTRINNPTRGFINETCDFCKNPELRPRSVIKDGLNVWTITNSVRVVNLHIHSKQLYQFSSIFDIQYDDIITGDRVLDLVEFIVTTKEIDGFHIRYRQTQAKKIFLDSEQISLPLRPTGPGTGQDHPAGPMIFFVYTHILEYFIDILYRSKAYVNTDIVIYTHNSDHSMTRSQFDRLTAVVKTIKVWTQNPSFVHESVKMLPIGIANQMWPHGSLESLYTLMSDTYRNKKTKGLHVSINPKTYAYRSVILEAVKQLGHIESEPQPFDGYLKQLGSHRFSLCIRGNGIDTHRFWESLYLRTIPVVLNDSVTDIGAFVHYARGLGVPFIEYKNVSDIPGPDYFNEDLYRSVVGAVGLCKALKISTYCCIHVSTQPSESFCFSEYGS